MTLTEFLLARIAEDEAVARDLIAEGPWAEFHAGDNAGPSRDDEYSALHVGAGRVLAECEAKMGILDLHREGPAGRHPPYCRTCEGSHGWPCATLRFLALPHADHPDYRAEWKP